jgi:sugar lactone lactonase YvrE
MERFSGRRFERLYRPQSCLIESDDMTKFATTKAIALSLLLTSGCQAPMPLHQMKQPWFALGQADPLVPATAANLPASASGQLTVRFDGELARLAQGRRIQATVADVDSVLVTVLPQGGTEVIQTVPKTSLINGQTSVTFQGLPPGDATITITAFDAAGANIGSIIRTATVTTGQVTTVDATLQLNPSIIGGGTGGGGTTTTGGLAASVTLSNGPAVTAPAIGDSLGAFALDGYPWSVAVDSAGQAWVGGGDGQLGGKLWQVAPNGAVLRNLPFDGGVGTVAIDGQGQIWALEQNGNTSVIPVFTLYRYNADGVRLSSLQFDAYLNALTLKTDANGRVWVYSLTEDRLFKMAPDGTIESETALDGLTTAYADDFAIGANGEVWVTYSALDQICRFSSVGNRLNTTPVPTGLNPGKVSVDSGGNAWVHSTAQAQPKLWRFDPSGTLVETHDIGYTPGLTLMIHQGDVWCGGNPMYRMPAGGAAPIEMTNLNYLPFAMATGSSGLWMVELNQQRVVRIAL